MHLLENCSLLISHRTGRCKFPAIVSHIFGFPSVSSPFISNLSRMQSINMLVSLAWDNEDRSLTAKSWRSRLAIKEQKTDLRWDDDSGRSFHSHTVADWYSRGVSTERARCQELADFFFPQHIFSTFPNISLGANSEMVNWQQRDERGKQQAIH